MENQTLMQCPRCQRNNVSVQLLNQIDLVPKKKSRIWWILIGWWYVPMKWIILAALFKLLIIPLKMLKPKKYQTNNRVEKYLVCNFCGHTWKD